MKVKATKPGFHERVYEAGETFNIPEDRFSEKWMKKIKPRGKAKAAKRAKSQAEPPPTEGEPAQ